MFIFIAYLIKIKSTQEQVKELGLLVTKIEDAVVEEFFDEIRYTLSYCIRMNEQGKDRILRNHMLCAAKISNYSNVFDKVYKIICDFSNDNTSFPKQNLIAYDISARNEYIGILRTEDFYFPKTVFSVKMKIK